MHPRGLFGCVVTSRISADTGLLPLRLIIYLRPLHGAFLPSLNSRDLANPAPGRLVGSMTADNSTLHNVPFHGKLPDRSHPYTFGASVGCPFHGQGASGDRVSSGEGAAGIESLKGLFRGYWSPLGKLRSFCLCTTA